jgi:hypothetical protein
VPREWLRLTPHRIGSQPLSPIPSPKPPFWRRRGRPSSVGVEPATFCMATRATLRLGPIPGGSPNRFRLGLRWSGRLLRSQQRHAWKPLDRRPHRWRGAVGRPWPCTPVDALTGAAPLRSRRCRPVAGTRSPVSYLVRGERPPRARLAGLRPPVQVKLNRSPRWGIVRLAGCVVLRGEDDPAWSWSLGPPATSSSGSASSRSSSAASAVRGEDQRVEAIAPSPPMTLFDHARLVAAQPS